MAQCNVSSGILKTLPSVPPIPKGAPGTDLRARGMPSPAPEPASRLQRPLPRGHPATPRMLSGAVDALCPAGRRPAPEGAACSRGGPRAHTEPPGDSARAGGQSRQAPTLACAAEAAATGSIRVRTLCDSILAGRSRDVRRVQGESESLAGFAVTEWMAEGVARCLSVAEAFLERHPGGHLFPHHRTY